MMDEKRFTGPRHPNWLEDPARLAMPVAAVRGRIYVDAAVNPFRDMLMAHMFSPDLDALHAMAELLGIRRWFQDPATMKVSWPHYDISAEMRIEVIRLGVIPVDRYQTVVMANHIIGRPQQQTSFPPIVRALEWLEREIRGI